MSYFLMIKNQFKLEKNEKHNFECKIKQFFTYLFKYFKCKNKLHKKIIVIVGTLLNFQLSSASNNFEL